MNAQSLLRSPACAPAGETDIPGLTDEQKPRSRGPKRANKIRKLYNLGKDDDVRTAAKLHGKTVEGKDGKKYTKTVKIQRLITPQTLQRKRHRAALKRRGIEKVRPTSPASCDVVRLLRSRAMQWGLGFIIVYVASLLTSRRHMCVVSG